MRLPRYRTGDPELDLQVAAVVEQVADPANADLVFEMVAVGAASRRAITPTAATSRSPTPR